MSLLQRWISLWFCLILQITNQPLIAKIMSPNPLQRKVLYKKTEVPFCLNALREGVKNRRKRQRSVVEKKILPWDLNYCTRIWNLQSHNCLSEYVRFYFVGQYTKTLAQTVWLVGLILGEYGFCWRKELILFVPINTGLVSF